MILVFRDSLIFHTTFEIQRKRIENAVIYSWFSHYKEHVIGYGIDRSLSYIAQNEFDIFVPPHDEYFFEGYMEETMSSNLLAWFVNVGMNMYLNRDIVILVGRATGYSDQYLDCILHLVQDIYGVSYREVNCEEDIPEVPQDCDQLSTKGIFIIDRNLGNVNNHQFMEKAMNKTFKELLMGL